jgi:transcriptional regulator with XRE-family HTH domain
MLLLRYDPFTSKATWFFCMKELKIIGLNIARLRKERGYTQGDLCRLAQIDRSYLSEIENGKMNVTIGSLVRIAKSLKVKLDEIILA